MTYFAKKKTIKVLFDAHPLLGDKTGVGYYTLQLVKHLSQLKPGEIELVGYYHNFLGRKKVANLPTAGNISYRQIRFIPGQLVNALNRLGIRLPLELLTLTRADFILYPNFWGQPSIFKTPSAAVIHDLSYIDVPESVSKRNAQDLSVQVPHVLRGVRFAITVSEFSRQRIHETYDYPLNNILVTYIPASKPQTINPAQHEKLLSGCGLSSDRYILFIGTLEPRKNLINLLNAYSQLPSSIQKKYPLVIAGKIDWKYESTVQKLKELEESNIPVKYLGYVDDQMRAALYQGARCFVLPSLYEGFGMPIIEALSYRVPVCASDISVFREVAGPSIEYFDPANTKSIATTIHKTLKKTTKTSKVQPTAAQRLSWDDIANAVYDRIYRSISRMG